MHQEEFNNLATHKIKARYTDKLRKCLEIDEHFWFLAYTIIIFIQFQAYSNDIVIVLFYGIRSDKLSIISYTFNIKVSDFQKVKELLRRLNKKGMNNWKSAKEIFSHVCRAKNDKHEQKVINQLTLKLAF